MHINDIVNVRDRSGFEAMPLYWRGKVTEIRDNGGTITVQDRGINFAELDIDELEHRDGEYWEK